MKSYFFNIKPVNLYIDLFNSESIRTFTILNALFEKKIPDALFEGLNFEHIKIQIRKLLKNLEENTLSKISDQEKEWRRIFKNFDKSRMGYLQSWVDLD